MGNHISIRSNKLYSAFSWNKPEGQNYVDFKSERLDDLRDYYKTLTIEATH
jgi:hypothetical protein